MDKVPIASVSCKPNPHLLVHHLEMEPCTTSFSFQILFQRLFGDLIYLAIAVGAITDGNTWKEIKDLFVDTAVVLMFSSYGGQGVHYLASPNDGQVDVRMLVRPQCRHLLSISVHIASVFLIPFFFLRFN